MIEGDRGHNEHVAGRQQPAAGLARGHGDPVLGRRAGAAGGLAVGGFATGQKRK